MHPCPFSGAAAPAFDHPGPVPSPAARPVDAAPPGAGRSHAHGTAPAALAEGGRR